MSEKIIKWWASFSWWMKLKGFIALFGVGGEVTMILTDQLPKYHVITVCAGLFGIAITHLIQDKNNNGLVDFFEYLFPNKFKKK